jgi:uncharacterized membrane protein
MMAQYKVQYRNIIKCSVEEAFQLAMDMDRRPEWIDFISKCHFTDQKPGMIGSRYREVSVFLGIPLNIEYDIIAYEENARIKSRCTMGPLYPIVEVTYKPVPQGVDSTLTVELTLGPLALMPKFVLKSMIDNLFNRFIKNYIDILEERKK